MDDSSSVIEQQQICGFDRETFRNQFLCSQCNDFFKEPQSLSCFESFCCAVRKNIEQNRERETDEDRPFSLSDGDTNEIEIGYGNEEINDEHLICSRGRNSGERHYLEDARLLPCLHPFCFDCLEKEIKKQANMQQEVYQSADEANGLNGNEPVPFACPVDGCGESTGRSILIYGNDRIEWSNELRNSSLQNMVHSVCFKNRLAKHEEFCDACPGKIAVAVCIDESDSDLSLCQDCLERHQSVCSTSKHKIISIPELSESSVVEGIPKSLHHRAPFCQIHRNNRIRMYCPDHSTVVCLICACTATEVGGHEQCPGKFDVEVHPDSGQGQQHRQQFDEKVQRMTTLRQEFGKAIRNTNLVKKSLDMYYHVLLKEICCRCEKLQQKLEEQREELIAQSQQIYNLKQLELNSHLEMLNEVKSNIGDSLEWIKKFTKAAIPADFFLLKKKMENRMDSLITQSRLYMSEGDSKHPDVFLANDVIQYDFNDEMTIEDAMGEVYSTPCLRNFSVLEGKPVRLACKDIFGTCLYKDLPKLEAALLPYELSDQGDNIMRGIVCSVILHPEHGIYTFFVDAQVQPGSYHLLISHPNPPAYFDYEKHGKIIKLKYSCEDGFTSTID